MNRVVLVTGSTQGIGKAIAAAFVKAGYHVCVHCSKDMEKAECVREEIGAHKAVVCALSDIFGENIVCTNEKSNNVVVLSLKGGRILDRRQTLSITHPLCVFEAYNT